MSQLNSQENYPADIRAILELVDKETDRQVNLHGQYSAGVSTRAALLVTTAVVVVSLPRTESIEGSYLYGAALISAFFAALLGVFGLLLNKKGEEVSLENLETEIWNLSSLEAIRAITNEKITSLEQDRGKLEKRHRLIVLGFAFLTLSIFSTVLHLIFGL